MSETSNTELTVPIGKFTRVAMRRRLAEDAAKKHKERADSAETEREALKKEIADIKASPDSKRVNELQQQIRDRDYRAAFDAKASKAGIKPAHLDRAWKLASIDTSKPQIDDAAIEAVVASHKTEIPEWFGESAAATTETKVEASIVKPAPGSGRSAPVAGGPTFDETAAASDPVYVMNNYARVVEGYKAKHNL